MRWLFVGMMTHVGLLSIHWVAPNGSDQTMFHRSKFLMYAEAVDVGKDGMDTLTIRCGFGISTAAFGPIEACES